MRSRSVLTALAALTVGVTAAAVLRRLAVRRAGSAVIEGSVPAEPARPQNAAPASAAMPGSEGVVLPFARRGTEEPAPAVRPEAAPAGPAGRVRCGDSGGLTKAGAPCGARATSGGRCHHHRLAA